ncbi:electron transfer flavoprotein beta subunit, partial [Puccinia sorghi]
LKVEEPPAQKAGQIFDNVHAVVAKLKEIGAR